MWKVRRYQIKITITITINYISIYINMDIVKILRLVECLK